MVSYPAVLLVFPLRAEGVERLAPLGAVGELEEAGEHASVVGCVWEDGVLEVDTMGEDVVVLIHPAEEINRNTEKIVLGCTEGAVLMADAVQKQEMLSKDI